MDAKNLLESLDFSKENIHRQASVYSFSNILALSLLSGFGIKYDISDKTLENFIEKLNEELNINNTKLSTPSLTDDEDLSDNTNNKFSINNDFHFIKDLNPIKAIYSKTNLALSSNDKLEGDTNLPFEFADKEFEKKLTPKNQGLLILNEINLSKLLYNKSIIKRNQESSSEEKLIAMVLLDLAINQAIFSHNHLRNNNGLFVEKLNLSSDLDMPNFEESKRKIDWEDQVYMLCAYALLYEVLDKPNLKRYFDLNKARLFKSYAFDLINILEHHEYEIIELETANLSSFISSFFEALNILDNKQKYLSFALSLCDELYAREKQKGFMLSHRHAREAASLASHFKSIEALTNGFRYTNFNLFLNASEEIYNNLNSVWDNNLGLFNLDEKNNIKYSSKSISYVLKSLNKLLKTTSSPNLKKSIENQLTNFFDSSINGAGLQAPPPSLRINMNMFRSSNTVSSVIEDMIEEKKVYVIDKGFEINKDNNQIDKCTNEFSSEHVLFASDAMLSLAIEED